tara:strand:- start:6457 stop:7254 length:798 start_codon:yes stop_codon:yes gene_type:complete
MPNPNYEQLTISVVQIAKVVGRFIQTKRENFSTVTIEEKGKHDLVTAVDKAAEEQLVEKLSELLPEAGFIAEEGTSSKVGDVYNWVVDPIDGTTNFIHALPCYSISIALKENDQVVLGVVYEITRMECFYAWKDSDAFLNGHKISVSQNAILDNALIATGFPYNDYAQLKEYLRLFEDLLTSSRGVRRLGSAAVDLAYVACGRFDAFYEYSLKPWDVSAGAFLVERAGGELSDFQGSNEHYSGKSIVATNSKLHDVITTKISTYF